MPTSATEATELGRRIEAGLMAEHRLANEPGDPSRAEDLRTIAAVGRAASEPPGLAHHDPGFRSRRRIAPRPQSPQYRHGCAQTGPDRGSATVP